jgi:DNA primase
MRIPDSKIDEVRSASDIVDVIASYVRLKKRGKNFLGLCPFHQEKTPSFSVSAEKQMYHCFGCGAGGNVFTFVMEHDKVSFIEAVRTLAQRAGIALPEEGTEDRKEATENEALYAACRMAGLHFHENLTTTVEGKLALEYFHHRGFSDETIRKFGLGYSLNGWDGLIKHADREHVDLAILEKAGLVLAREDTMPDGRQGSGHYDRFRGRAMFPIFSASGRTIGFGARKMREDDPLGKYINSPETPIYNKSRVLYGLCQSKDAIREKEYALLVEGYADLISVYQAGIENVVASSGTALTEEQILLVGRYARNVTLVYDADSAGSKATLRGVDLIIENGLDVKVATLPSGEDPDSFVKKNGGTAFQALLDGAVSFLDFKAEHFKSEGFLGTPEGQTRAVRSIVETIAKMKDELKRNFYIKSVSEKYGIYETVLFRELGKLLGQERTRIQNEKQRVQSSARQETAAQETRQPVAEEIPVPQRDLLRLMLEHRNEMVEYVFSHVGEDAFAHPGAQQVVRMIRAHVEAGDEWDVTLLVNEADDAETKRFIADVVFSKYEISKGWAEIGSEPEEADPWAEAEQCIALLRKQDLDGKIAENQGRMKEAAARGEEVMEYLERHQTLLNEKKEMEKARLVRSETPTSNE